MHKRYDPVALPESSKGPPAPRSFPPKHLNIMDPLLPTNNLGRSVNQASAKRIRLAFRYGASTLQGILAKVISHLIVWHRDQRSVSHSPKALLQKAQI